jgi:hypothetical protein
MTENNNKRGVRYPNYGQDPKRKFGDDREEYATEIVPDNNEIKEKDREHRHEAVTTYGWIGIVLSFLSFLVWPLFLGITGIVLGFVSRSKGADTLGNIAIGLGVVAILLRLFI